MTVASSRSGLENFPTEIIETIVQQLDLTAIGHLRLSSRRLATKASYGSYKSHFRSRTVYWNAPDALPSFAAVTAASDLTSLLEDLNIVGSLDYDYENDIEQATQLLTEALSNLRSAAPDYRLASLTLSVRRIHTLPHTAARKYVPPSDWKSRWKCAMRTFDCAMTALSRSGLELSRLDIFRSPDGWVLAIDRACSIIAATPLDHVLSSLQEISVGLSRSVDWRPEADVSAPPVNEPTPRQDLAMLLNTPKDLKSLEVRWYHLSSTSLTPYEEKQDHLFLRDIIPFRP